MAVVDIHMPIISAAGLVRVECKVAFDAARSCLEHERIGKKIPVTMQNGMYMMKAGVVVPGTLKGTKSVTWVAPLETPPKPLIEADAEPCVEEARSIGDHEVPSQQEQEEHALIHEPKKSRCAVCTQCKGRDVPHRRTTPAERAAHESLVAIPVVQMDFMHPGVA